MTDETHRALAPIEDVYQQGRKDRRDGKSGLSPMDMTQRECEWWRRGWTFEDFVQRFPRVDQIGDDVTHA